MLDLVPLLHYLGQQVVQHLQGLIWPPTIVASDVPLIRALFFQSFAMDPVAQSKATVQKIIASLLDAGDTHSNEMSFYSGQLWCDKLDKFGRFLASIKIILSFRF